MNSEFLESLNKLSKKQLLQVAEHFSAVDVGDKRQENIKDAIRAKLRQWVDASGQAGFADMFCGFIFHPDTGVNI